MSNPTSPTTNRITLRRKAHELVTEARQIAAAVRRNSGFGGWDRDFCTAQLARAAELRKRAAELRKDAERAHIAAMLAGARDELA